MAADVVIVGGGVMGCSVALRLAEAGLRPLVLERSVPGAEASSAAAGILGPLAEADHATPAVRPAAALRLGVKSRQLHAALAEQLRAEHGVSVGFRRCGLMRVAFDERELESLDRHAALLERAIVERIDGDEARRREASLSPDVVGALDLPEEAQLEPPLLLRGLALAAERAGAVFRSGAYVREVIVEGERARGVRVGRERVEAEHVVVAAGSWTDLVRGIERDLDLEAAGLHPVRGQIVATETRPPVFRRIVFGAGGYVVTRPDGRALCGSTEEHVGFRREVTFAGMRGILDLALRIAPRMAEAPVLDRWSSFRPGTRDGLPLVGPTGTEGLWLATGHFRNGILLAPITAEIVRSAILRQPLPLGSEAVDPRRFRRRA